MKTFIAIHKYYNSCFNDNDMFDSNKVIDRGLIDNVYSTEFRINMLEKIYYRVLDNPLVKDIVLKYIKNSSMSVDSVIEQWNMINDNKINKHTAHTHVSYCSNKINEIFNEEEYNGKKICIIEWLLDKKNFMGMTTSSQKMEIRDRFVNQLKEYTDRFSMTTEYDKDDILLNIPAYKKVSEITNDEYDRFIEVIRPYSKFVKNTAQEVIDSMRNEVGYFRYLFSKYSELNDTDRERKGEILALLGKSTCYDFETFDENSKILADFNSKRNDYIELIDYEFSDEDIIAFKNISDGNEYLSKDEILDIVLQSIIKNKINKKV